MLWSVHIEAHNAIIHFLEHSHALDPVSLQVNYSLFHHTYYEHKYAQFTSHHICMLFSTLTGQIARGAILELWNWLIHRQIPLSVAVNFRILGIHL